MRKVVCLAVIYNRRLLVIKRRGKWGLPGKKPRATELDVDCIFRAIEEVPDLRLKDLMPLGKFNGRNFLQWEPLKEKVFLAKAEKIFFDNYSKCNGRIKWIKNLEEDGILESTRRIFWILKGEGCL